MAYIVDVSKLTINTRITPKCYYIKRWGAKLDLNKVLWAYSNMPALSLTNYTPKITGSAYTNDAWVIPETLPEFTDKSTPGNFIARGSFPVFNQQCSKGPGEYYLHIVDDTLYLRSGSIDGAIVNYWTGSDFVDGVIPDRMLLVMSGGGGGGSANAGAIALAIPIGGSDGGSGGSGGFFAVVINTRKLKTETFAFYFRVGSGGHGGTAYVVSAASGVANWAADGGSNGESSSFGFIRKVGPRTPWSSITTIMIAGGGGGAPGHNTYEAGTAGAAGIVMNGTGTSLDTSEASYKDDYWWYIPIKDSNGVDCGRSFEHGLAGKAQGNGAGPSTPARSLRVSSTTGTSIAKHYLNVGNKSGGGYSTNSTGGAASYFGAGGRGGYDGDNCQGYPGETSAGGGGARYHAYIQYKGGDGGDGVMYLYY